MNPDPLNAYKKTICIALIFVFGSTCLSAIAGNNPSEIIMASEEWTNATNRDGTGLYWDIFRAVYEPVGIKTKFIIQSYMESVLNKGIIEVSRYMVETVLELDRYLVFADIRKGRKLKKIFDHRFPRLVKSGDIERLIAKWNW